MDGCEGEPSHEHTTVHASKIVLTLNFAVSSRLDVFVTGSACNGKDRCSAFGLGG